MTTLDVSPTPVPASPGRTPQPDPRARRTLEILDHLLDTYGPRDFAVRLWDGSGRDADPGQPTRFTFVLKGPDVLYRMLVPPGKRSAGEAYLSGDVDVEGDLIEAVGIVRAMVSGLSPRKVARLVTDVARLRPRAGNRPMPTKPGLRGRLHTPERDKVAVRYHYDVGTDFYALWLDPRMVYSCSYFPTGEESLAASQERKLEHICRKLRLHEGERFLDLGCGFGGLVMYAAERHGVDATGITLSREHGLLAQRRIRERGLEGRCRVEIMDYRQLSSDRAFDKIAGIGIIEHVGENRLPEFFGKVWSLLRPGSLFLNHGICWPGTNRAYQRALSRLPFRRNFIHRYVFPDLDLLPLHVILRAAGRVGFEVRDVENLREHYAITLRHWLEGLEANWERAVEEVGRPTARLWRAYLAYSSHSFARADINLIHTLFARPDERGRVEIPLTRADMYAAVTAEGHA
ncbi:MAG: class I SAM-dependent methyltransferase [Gemmatimonadetes bacterium]|nr:class I SAM-dependent methyltransferase [Gemmatimonadota bacterium]